ncbi:hypothetical protein LJB88_01275 [Erysipelotrichaceae bacterium OttesenSCG-928-M19]|nr:hypothetical protein [Erysipelotrichaceae bacterium OttesenSCG-928-M19]
MKHNNSAIGVLVVDCIVLFITFVLFIAPLVDTSYRYILLPTFIFFVLTLASVVCLNRGYVTNNKNYFLYPIGYHIFCLLFLFGSASSISFLHLTCLLAIAFSYFSYRDAQKIMEQNIAYEAELSLENDDNNPNLD